MNNRPVSAHPYAKTVSTIQPGTLFVIDTFATPGHKQRDREHGDRVVDAAVHEGFRRTVINDYTSTVPNTNKHALDQSKLQGVF